MMDSEHKLVAARREKLEALRNLDVKPFGGPFPTDGTVGEIRKSFAEEKSFRAAGRITAHRDMGKSQFLDISDATGRIQVYVNRRDHGPEAQEIFSQLDLGDFLGVEGVGFITKTGEPTLRVQKFQPLCKALRPLPDKWHGLADVEQRYRQRYLDLIANEEARSAFFQRITMIREIRRFLEERGFLEVETPMMQAVPGGAAATPFQTRHKALGLDLYLRIAPELYLKRLLVGGFPKIFELNRNFRNEGISRRHNPEFTMLELYEAYGNFETMAELVESMIVHLATLLHGSPVLEHKDAEGNPRRTINLTPPWRRADYQDLLREIDPGWFDYSPAERRSRCAELGVEVSPHLADHEVTHQVFEKLVEEKTFDPLFVTGLPKELVPLANPHPQNSELVEVYELIINGQEISPGYSELNDPDLQRQRLEDQAGEEVQALDEDFLEALEYGMPPAGGLGLGIDRLTMLLTGAESIRDVIFFPQLKPRQE